MGEGGLDILRVPGALGILLVPGAILVVLWGLEILVVLQGWLEPVFKYAADIRCVQPPKIQRSFVMTLWWVERFTAHHQEIPKEFRLKYMVFQEWLDPFGLKLAEVWVLYLGRVAVRGGTKAGRDRGLPGLNNHWGVAATMALGRLISAVITLLNEVNLDDCPCGRWSATQRWAASSSSIINPVNKLEQGGLATTVYSPIYDNWVALSYIYHVVAIWH